MRGSAGEAEERDGAEILSRRSTGICRISNMRVAAALAFCRELLTLEQRRRLSPMAIRQVISSMNWSALSQWCTMRYMEYRAINATTMNVSVSRMGELAASMRLMRSCSAINLDMMDV